MSSSQHLYMITSYMQWANSVFYEAVSNLSEGDLVKKRPMLFDNILSLLHNVYLMQVVWMSHLQCAPHNLQSRRPLINPPLTDLWEMQSDLDTWYVDYAKRLKA